MPHNYVAIVDKDGDCTSVVPVVADSHADVINMTFTSPDETVLVKGPYDIDANTIMCDMSKDFTEPTGENK